MNIIRRVSLLLAVLSLFALPAEAQYFGRNAVQYETFHFKILRTQHFDVYFYDKEAASAAEAARMAERWYARLSTVLRHQLNGRQPLILYADHPDFEQTNVLGEQPGEGTGGVTESLKRRIILPMGASLAETDHVIGHELVHAFQYDITGVGRGSMATGLNRVPLWFIEGMAEYLSIGPVDPNTTMWVRDAVRRGELPKFGQLDDFKYFPYRWGQAFWAYMGGTYGDDVVGALLRSAGRSGNVQLALEQMTHRPVDSLFADWHRGLTESARQVAAATGTELPTDKARYDRERERPVTASGARLLVTPGKERHYNLAPALSPDGRRMVYMSDAGLFSIDMYLADAETGRTIRKLISATRDPHLESMQFISSAGAWDASGTRFVFGAVVTGHPALRIVNGSNGDLIKEAKFSSLGEIFNPTWSPDGNKIAFSAQVGGYTDLFVYDVGSGQLQRLTEDAFADLEPAWSPDGTEIAFVTDRFGTSIETLSYGNYRLALMNANGGQIRALPQIEGAKHINPQWSADGASIYFISDAGGISNVYRLGLADGALAQVTNLFTGVSGITALSPALSVAQKSQRAVFSVYTGGGYAIQALDDPQILAGGPLRDLPKAAAILPPLDREVVGTGIAALLNDASQGLPQQASVELASAVKAYHPKLSLDFVAQPSLAIAADRFGTYVGGGVTLYWSDMLGDHNLVTMAQVNGRIEDFAALLAYANRKSRLNWMVGAQQIPYITAGITGYDTTGTLSVAEIHRFKQTNQELSGIFAYPFNRSRRAEFSAGVSRISFSHDVQRILYDRFTGQVFDESGRQEIDDAPNALNLFSTTAALVHDNSFFGATGPILGDRWRIEADPTFGSLQFVTALADYRKYVMPMRPFTLAGRILHVGRYGRNADDGRIYPLFIGYPSLVRGYDIGSFDVSECGGTGPTCPVFDQLVGSRLLVANAELRFPPFGLLGLGGGYYGILPVDAGIFYDAGVAWTGAEGAKLFGNGPRRIVRSAGISFRMNLLGYAIGQMDIVHPFDRPQKDWMLRFSLTQGF
ncbi:MAG TPA: BamA/TamA family outer membrane protein [Gemmatimonadales bacterium]|nr:BamA/TamA family outer membrane protein [Gemmatimonadales bacterium]